MCRHHYNSIDHHSTPPTCSSWSSDNLPPWPCLKPLNSKACSSSASHSTCSSYILTHHSTPVYHSNIMQTWLGCGEAMPCPNSLELTLQLTTHQICPLNNLSQHHSTYHPLRQTSQTCWLLTNNRWMHYTKSQLIFMLFIAHLTNLTLMFTLPTSLLAPHHSANVLSKLPQYNLLIFIKLISPCNYSGCSAFSTEDVTNNKATQLIIILTHSFEPNHLTNPGSVHSSLPVTRTVRGGSYHHSANSQLQQLVAVAYCIKQQLLVWWLLWSAYWTQPHKLNMEMCMSDG